MITSSFYGGPCMDGRVSPEPVSTLRSRATTNYLASFHSDDFCCIKTGITSPDQPYVTSDVSGGNGPSYLGAFRPSSSLPGFTFSDPSDNSRAPVSGNGANCSLKFPPGLWSEAGSALVNAQSLAQCNFLDLSESFSSLSAGPSSQLAAPEFSLSSLPPSGSGTSVQSEALSHQYFLSNLKFLGTLGRGGYGKVLLAESSRSGNHSSRVAVKVLTKRWMSIDDVREVKTEVQILEALSRRNGPGSAFLQRIHAAFQTKEHVFIVMERLCTTLSDIAIQRQFSLRPQGSSATLGPRTLPNSVSLPATFPSTLPYSDALGSLRLLSAELILGLLFLHGQGIVHQDVKPANVLVSADGHAVITDLGSARLRPLSAPSRTTYAECFDDAPDFSSNSAWEDAPPRATAYFGPIILSANDQVSFTRRYAAPELLYAPVWMSGRNVLVYDERVDYYSLGVMLHELALGDPYDSCNSQDRWERASDGPSRSTTLSVDAAFLSFIDGVCPSFAPQTTRH
ncbi:kinase-like domain-containing protein [Dichomitus squalens]|nr:kinase-like domain-containing protein [Dichomitus squalens]